MNKRAVATVRPLIMAAGSAAAPAFSPIQITGLVGWYDASDSSTITLSGSNVTQWDDKSGSGYHLIQGTAGNQPVISAASQNGLDAVTFVSSDFMDASNPASMIGVSEITSLAVVSCSSAAATARVAYGVFGTITNLCWYLIKQTTHRISNSLSFNGSTESNLQNIQAFIPTDDSTSLIGFRYLSGTSTTRSTYLDATEETATITAGSLYAATASLRFGAGVSAAAPWIGDICEVVVYNKYISDANLVLLKNYLTTKWAV